jgi:hypothetical protein
VRQLDGGHAVEKLASQVLRVPDPAGREDALSALLLVNAIRSSRDFMPEAALTTRTFGTLTTRVTV